MTWVFLGRADELDLEAGRALAAQWRRAVPATVRVDRLAGFPSNDQARVIVACVESDGWLEGLIRDAVPDVEVDRPLRPHVTLGYVRQGEVSVDDVFGALTVAPPLDIALADVGLYSSNAGVHTRIA